MPHDEIMTSTISVASIANPVFRLIKTFL
jgi:hypothetical protein